MQGVELYGKAHLLKIHRHEIQVDLSNNQIISCPKKKRIYSLFTSYLSSLFGITDYVRRGFYSSADYPYTASKGKDAFTGLVYAYGCTDACAPIRRF